MNYIELIKNFWTSHNANSFNTTEIALYFYLLEVFNICQWKNQIKRNNRRVEADLDISYNTLKSARNKLQQSGLLSFKSRNGDANVTYTLSKFDEVSVEVASGVGIEVGTRSMHIKDKLNKTIYTHIGDSDFLISDFFENVMNELLEDQVHLETLCMKHKKTIPDMQNYIKHYFVDQTCEGRQAITLGEAKQHFKNWLPYYLDKEAKKEKGGIYGPGNKQSSNADSESRARKEAIMRKATNAIAKCNSNNVE